MLRLPLPNSVVENERALHMLSPRRQIVLQQLIHILVIRLHDPFLIIPLLIAPLLLRICSTESSKDFETCSVRVETKGFSIGRAGRR